MGAKKYDHATPIHITSHYITFKPGDVIILDMMTLCNHSIMKTPLVVEGKGRKIKSKQKVHIKMENVPRILSMIVASSFRKCKFQTFH